MPLPDDVLAIMIDQDGTPTECLPPSPLSRLYRETFKASGLTRVELHERLAWGTNVSKVLRHFDSLLDGTCEIPGFEDRFVEVMGIPGESLIRARAENVVWCDEALNHRNRSASHNVYRSLGPYVLVFPNEKWKPVTNNSRHGFEMIRRIPIDMACYPKFEPPSPENMGQTIAKSPELIIRNLLPLSHIGGYLYHRLPDELHTFDTSGNLKTWRELVAETNAQVS